MNRLIVKIGIKENKKTVYTCAAKEGQSNARDRIREGEWVYSKPLS